MNHIVLIFLILTTSFSYADDFIVMPDDDKRLRSPLEVSWAEFLTDKCEMFDTRNTEEEDLRSKGLRRCRDKTISYIQPNSTGAGGWEGKCGHTYAANAFYSLCREGVAPDTYFNKYLRDLTPGVRPNTLKKGLNRVFAQNSDICPSGVKWKYQSQRSTENFIKRIKQLLIPNYSHRYHLEVERAGESYFRNPVAALIQNPGGKYLHWVNIVDILSDENTCKFVINHWDNQYEVGCELFATWSKKVGQSYPIILKSFSLVSLD